MSSRRPAYLGTPRDLRSHGFVTGSNESPFLTRNRLPEVGSASIFGISRLSAHTFRRYLSALSGHRDRFKASWIKSAYHWSQADQERLQRDLESADRVVREFEVGFPTERSGVLYLTWNTGLEGSDRRIGRGPTPAPPAPPTGTP